ncbi:MAG: MarR family winged helix-turn-helix transcriptional regulator [Candidatus Dormibacteria bacterium]|jgi:DNA-binding MarR family transcriptional regulator
MIGETENSLRALLNKILIGSGLDFHGWAALQVVSMSPAPLIEEQLAAVLQNSLKIDEPHVLAVIADLRAQGLIDNAPEAVGLTAQGSELYSRLNGEVRPKIAEIFEGLDPDDLAAAYRVLAAIMARANALLAA